MSKTSTSSSGTVVFLFIYASQKNPTTKKILGEITEKNLLITPMRIKNEKIKNWLVNNEMGVRVTEVPCFIVKLPNGKPVIYSAEDHQKVYAAVSKLQQGEATKT